MTPRIAVVVVTWNSAGQLPDLVASIGPGLQGLQHQLIVVDNDSADDTVARASELAPGCTIVHTGRNAGYSAGINAGMAAADPYDAVLVLNPDIRLTPGCVASHCDSRAGWEGEYFGGAWSAGSVICYPNAI